MEACDWVDFCGPRFDRLENKVDLLIEAKTEAELKLGALKWAVKHIPHLLMGLIAGTCGGWVHHLLAQ